MIIDGFLGDRLYSVALDEDEYALFSELEEQREFANMRQASKSLKAAIETGRTQGYKEGMKALRNTKAWQQRRVLGKNSKLYRKSINARDQILEFD